MARLTLVVLLALAATGCLGTSDLTRAQAHALVAHGARLVDVRSPDEFAERHPPEAINIPLPDFKRRMSELDRATPVVVYCHTGVRALVAARWLKQAGYPAVHNLGTLGHWYVDPSESAP